MDHGKIVALDTTENLKRIYGETKAIEIILAVSDDGIPTCLRNFLLKVETLHPDLEIAKQPEGSDPAIIVSKSPEKVIETMIALTSEQKVKLEWLNIRKSTLEDVFIQTVSSEEDTVELSPSIPNSLRLAWRNLKVNMDPASLVVIIGLPAMYLIFLGTMFVSIVSNFVINGVSFNYTSYLAPGIVAFQTVMAGTIGGSMLWLDRRFGMFSQILSGPFTRTQYLTGHHDRDHDRLASGGGSNDYNFHPARDAHRIFLTRDSD